MREGLKEHAERQLRRAGPKQAAQVSVRLLLNNGGAMRDRQDVHIPLQEHFRQHTIRVETLDDGRRFRLSVPLRLELYFEVVQAELPDLRDPIEMPPCIHSPVHHRSEQV